MPTIPADTALAGNAWTLIADYSGDTDQPREVAVLNLSGSANSAEVLVDPLHVSPGDTAGPGGGDDGYPIAVGAEKSFMAIKAGGGRVGRVWGRSAGATVRVAVTVA